MLVYTSLLFLIYLIDLSLSQPCIYTYHAVLHISINSRWSWSDVLGRSS